MNTGTSTEELVAAGEAHNLTLKEWSQYKESVRTQTVPRGSLRSTLRLEPPIADFLGMKLSSRMIATLDKLAQNNLGFSQVKRVRLELTQELWDDALESKRALGQLFTALFNGGTASVGSLIPTLGPAHIGSLQLFCPATMPVADFVALSSSLVLNQMAKNLEVRYVSQSHVQLSTRDWWKWLAYSVFSQRARATSVLESIEIVKLHSMTTADMAVLTEVLAAEHPEEKLFGSPCGNFQEKSATIEAGASLIWQFNFRGEPVRGVPLLTLEPPIESARAFSDDGVSEWVDVMVPGEPEVTPQLLDVKLEFVKTRDAITAGLPLFLAAVGSSLRNLTLVVRNLELTINEILESCPNLAELSISVDTIDVQLQFSRSHELGQPFPEFGSFVWNDPVAVASALSDDCNSLSSCVYRTRAHPGDTDTPVGLSNIFDALLNMLACNSSLIFFEVAVPVQYDGYWAKFRKFHLQPTRHTSELPLESKIAFISVVSPLVGVSRTSQYRSPTRELDTDVLCKIFAFAASPVLRHVFAAAYHG